MEKVCMKANNISHIIMSIYEECLLIEVPTQIIGFVNIFTRHDRKRDMTSWIMMIKGEQYLTKDHIDAPFR